MNILSVIILGIVQGIAEFLPISSSAHLIIFRDIFGIGSGMSQNIEIAFDVALHLGTLLAIALYFFKDFITMIQKGLTKGVKDDEGKILWYLIVATIPAAIAGVLFEDVITNIIRNNYYVIAIALAIMGVIIYLADKYSKETKDIKKLSLKDSFLIGCSQVFALSAPVICGAVVLQLIDKSTWSIIASNASIFIIGILISFIIGLICIKYLLKYLQKHNFKIFMIYRIIIAIVVLVLTIIGG